VPFPWPCGESNLEAPRDKRRGARHSFHSTSWGGLVGTTWAALCGRSAGSATVVLPGRGCGESLAREV